MNNKGFTLTEILAVIVILAVISLVGVVSVGTIRNKMDKNIFETKIEHVVQAAEAWGQNNKTQLTQNLTINGSSLKGKTVTISNLIASGDLETDEKSSTGAKIVTNNTTNKSINALRINVYIEYNRVYACIIKDGTNAGLLGEDGSYSKYSHLNYYC